MFLRAAQAELEAVDGSLQRLYTAVHAAMEVLPLQEPGEPRKTWSKDSAAFVLPLAAARVAAEAAYRRCRAAGAQAAQGGAAALAGGTQPEEGGNGTVRDCGAGGEAEVGGGALQAN